MRKRWAAVILWVGAAIGFLYSTSNFIGVVPPLGTLLDPVEGVYSTARLAQWSASETVRLATLDAPVTVEHDARGVPHIFAQSNKDAITALGYLVARDRLFQLDFVPRVAAGQLSEAFGASMLDTDRFLRRTGMDWGAKNMLAQLEAEDAPQLELMDWYVAGANAYIESLDEHELPFEFRLLGYKPKPYSRLQMLRLTQYMAYDLSYHTDDADYAELRSRFTSSDFERLYPRFAKLFEPIIPEPGGVSPSDRAVLSDQFVPSRAARNLLAAHARQQRALQGTLAEGYRGGKGSNNWAVHAHRSATGAPILSDDMHLSLSLPAIWYEVHLVTPELNVYGVTLPGAPVPVVGFNDHVAWGFTNTGADVIDHYALTLDEERKRYLHEGSYWDLEVEMDTLFVNRGDPVIEPFYYAHWGPVLLTDSSAIATQWTAHKTNHTLRALWGMNTADSYTAFQEALKDWDSPMQNILVADKAGNIGIRSTGYLPIRKAGHGMGLLDGTSDAYAWTGRVPFDELPHSFNPEQGYLASANQQPADSTYAYYQGYDWGPAFRGLRINELLRAKEQHTRDDIQHYQSDVRSVQHQLFAPLLDTLRGLSQQAEAVQQALVAWDGVTDVDAPEPLLLDHFLEALRSLTWDEAHFEEVRRPRDARLYRLIVEQPKSSWFNIEETELVEDAAAVLQAALEQTAQEVEENYGWEPSAWRWGDHHKVVFRHLTQTQALSPLWRGPYEYPGFASTLSPGRGRRVTHSASWRMVVDFSGEEPVGTGVYPGGQHGSPFSRFYDTSIATYLAFEHHPLLRPRAPDELAVTEISQRLVLAPTP